MANKRLAIGAFLACFGLAGELWALDNDPKIYRLCKGYAEGEFPCGSSPSADQKAFRDLTKEYGIALSHKVLAPAETLGANGFQIGFSYSVTPNQADKDLWKRGTEGENSPSTLMTTEINVRKGLPFSFELGVDAGWLAMSEMFYFGGGLKWALNEAVSAFPIDFSVRGTVRRVFGSADLDLTLAGLDVLISHNFGIGGLFQLAPYAGYSPSFIFVSSNLIDGTPGVLAQGSDLENNFVFDDEDFVIHRFVGGFRFIFGAFNLTPEVVIADGHQSYQFFVGLDF